MTDDENQHLMWLFRSWDPNNPSENVPEGFCFFPPRWAWDSTEEHPPYEPVPCRRCGNDSQPYCRYEFTRDDGEVHPWRIGIGLFAYNCPDHGLFINQAIERGGSARNGKAVVV